MNRAESAFGQAKSFRGNTARTESTYHIISKSTYHNIKLSTRWKGRGDSSLLLIAILVYRIYSATFNYRVSVYTITRASTKSETVITKILVTRR